MVSATISPNPAAVRAQLGRNDSNCEARTVPAKEEVPQLLDPHLTTTDLNRQSQLVNVNGAGWNTRHKSVQLKLGRYSLLQLIRRDVGRCTQHLARIVSRLQEARHRVRLPTDDRLGDSEMSDRSAETNRTASGVLLPPSLDVSFPKEPQQMLTLRKRNSTGAQQDAHFELAGTTLASHEVRELALVPTDYLGDRTRGQASRSDDRS